MMRFQGWVLGLLLLAGWVQAAAPVADACIDKHAGQDALQAAVTTDVQRMAGAQVTVSIHAMLPWPVLSQPKVTVLSKSLRSRMAVTITGKSCASDRQVVETVWLKVQALREAWVYGRNAQQDSRVIDASPQREVIDIATLQIAGTELADSLEGQWLRQAVYAGRPVLQQQLRNDFLIRRDQSVVVVVRGPGLELRTQGKALQSASLGDHVQVLVSGAETSMPATAAGKGEVHVEVEM